jgi:membrane protein DedA with SNARE-associated domain
LTWLILYAAAIKLPHLHHLQGAPIDYVGVALASAASWIGVPGPGEPVLVAAGLFASKHKLDIGGVIVVAWAAATAGGIAGWLIGLKAGRALVTGRGPLRSTRLRALEHGEAVFRRYATIAIVLTPSWIAGINHVRAAVYLPVNAAAAVVWAAGIGLGAYFVGPTVLDLVNDLGILAGILVGAAAVAAVVGHGVRKRRRREHAIAAPDRATPDAP